MRVWGSLFSSLRFLEKLCLVCSFRFHKTHSSSLYLFYNHPHSPLKISLSFISLFFRKNSKFSSLTFRPRLASFWPKRWYERYKYLKRERISSFTHIQKHIYSINIMFAATQQIASIAGLKATKVQVRTLSSSSQYSFSGKDLVAFGARARVSLWIHFLRIQL